MASANAPGWWVAVSNSDTVVDFPTYRVAAETTYGYLFVEKKIGDVWFPALLCPYWRSAKRRGLGNCTDTSLSGLLTAQHRK